jgi:hypothetical protein
MAEGRVATLFLYLTAFEDKDLRKPPSSGAAKIAGFVHRADPIGVLGGGASLAVWGR